METCEAMGLIQEGSDPGSENILREQRSHGVFRESGTWPGGDREPQPAHRALGVG